MSLASDTHTHVWIYVLDNKFASQFQELQQGNGSLGVAGLGGMQEPSHSLKIKQEPFQVSPSSPLPPLHQGKSLVTKEPCRCATKPSKKTRSLKSLWTETRLDVTSGSRGSTNDSSRYLKIAFLIIWNGAPSVAWLSERRGTKSPGRK